jgi:hypothetical protein
MAASLLALKGEYRTSWCKHNQRVLSTRRTMASSIHWLAPASMLAALLAGILFALAHHVFYQALHGTAVPQTDYTLNAGGLSTNVSRQQLTLALGTAFAFATKSCLVIAVSIAWVQCFWRTLTTRSSGKPLTLDNVNTAFAVIHNAFTLVSPAGWRRFSSLFVLALVTWYDRRSGVLCFAVLTDSQASSDCCYHHPSNIDHSSSDHLSTAHRGLARTKHSFRRSKLPRLYESNES